MAASQEDLRVLAGRVAAHVSLRDVRLTKASVEHLGFPEPGLQLSYDLSIDPTAQFDPERQALVVLVNFTLNMEQTIGSEDEAESKPIASISFSYASMFETTGDRDYDDSELEAFGSTTGLFSLYPYAREYVQDVTGRLGLPPLVLDVYRVAPTDED